MDPHSTSLESTVRDTDGLKTTITVGPVNCEDQALSLDLSLRMSLPLPYQDEHLPDQIEAFVHQAGLEVQRRLFQVLIEKADQEQVLQHRRGKGGRRNPCPRDTTRSPSRRPSVKSPSNGPGSPTTTVTDRGPVGDGMEHLHRTRHHPESSGCGL